VKRRHALGVIVGLPAVWWPVSTASGQGSTTAPVIGLLDAGERLEWWGAFRDRLRELGYIEGKSIRFETRFARGTPDRVPALAQELVGLKVAVLVTSGTIAAQTAKRATSVIPIVMATGEDPVRLGIVASLARPGGNITGVTSLSMGLTSKRFEILHEVLPKLSRLAVLWHRNNRTSELGVRQLEAAGRAAKVRVQVLGVTGADELRGAFVAMTRERAGAVVVISDPFLFSERQRLAELTREHRLPSMHGPAEYVDAGGLLSYAPSYADLFRRAAVYVDKILKGAKPGELPIEQPTTLELVINRKTAKAWA
jgi:putative tryptophan/tyrosine transport system substrate-binding protein